MAGETRKCRVCGDRFSLTPIEIRAYEAKGWKVPEACRRCMAKPVSENELSIPKIVNQEKYGR